VLKSATELKRAVAVCSGQIAACKESGLTNFSHIHRSACRRIVGKNSLNRAIRPRLGRRIRSRLCRSCRLRGGGAASRFASILERGPPGSSAMRAFPARILCASRISNSVLRDRRLAGAVTRQPV
jgi:hypothetical protein